MITSSRTNLPNPNRCRLLQCIGVGLAIIATVSGVRVSPSAAAEGGSEGTAVVARVDPKNDHLTASELDLRIGNISVPVQVVKGIPEIPRSIAIVVDAGPNQSVVLSKEKALAIAVVNECSDGSTTFTIGTAGASFNPQATLDPKVAIEQIRAIVIAPSGGKRNIPIYDPIGSVIQRLSLRPSIRIIIFIGEGNDGGSIMRYPELRTLAESNHIAFFAALVADHSLRGARSILRYGWNLQALTDDTAGIFLENERIPKAAQRLQDSISALRLILFEPQSLPPGRYKVSVSRRQHRSLHAQKTMIIP